MTGLYARLGVKRRINAAGTLTRLGGSLMEEPVLEAMREAARASVDIGELQVAAGRAIARATGAEAGIVVAGAAAGLTLAAAACIAGLDVAKMARLPDTVGLPNEILIPRTHRNAYDHALRAAGAVLVDIGHNDRGTGAGIRGLEAWEIDAAVTPATVALAFAANPETAADLSGVVVACRRRGLPVIVDAAAQLPPATNLRAFFDAGADLVVFSGGKAIGGPQASGILAGRRDLIASALLQQLDMDVDPTRWVAPEIVDRDRVPMPPHHGIGRGFKVGKEEIVGLVVALERFVARDEGRYAAALRQRLSAIAAGLSGRRTRIVEGRVPILEIETRDGPAAVARLLGGEPPVHVGERDLEKGLLVVDLQTVAAGDDATLAAALSRALA
jgi:L-seryl-tRNA(Ser) seleniumtransferase